MWHSLHKQIEIRIENSPESSVFVVSDFADIASPKTVSKTLSRLSENGTLKKVMRGVFWKPDTSFDKPHPDSVARALARENLWRLVPCGDTALHMLGVSDKKNDETWTYITDGTYRNYTYDGIKISFMHASGKAFSAMSERSALLVQVLKAYGKDCISDEALKKIRTLFSPDEITKILQETKHTTEWVYKMIKNMFGMKTNNAD